MSTTLVKETPESSVKALPAYGTPDEPKVKGGNFWGVIRIAVGWVFLWSFLDKAFALGFSTGRNPETGVIDFFGPDAWINGASPTAGFLQFGVHSKEPFTGFYQGLAGATWVDWVYMLSLLAIGTALIFGLGTRLAAIGGIIWMAILYTAAAVWPEFNPFLDEHVVYAIALAGIAYVGAGRYLGFGGWWERTALVQRFPILK
jgi:thiosulfate dehydrogenase [quinone] large subunit